MFTLMFQKSRTKLKKYLRMEPLFTLVVYLPKASKFCTMFCVSAEKNGSCIRVKLAKLHDVLCIRRKNTWSCIRGKLAKFTRRSVYPPKQELAGNIYIFVTSLKMRPGTDFIIIYWSTLLSSIELIQIKLN